MNRLKSTETKADTTIYNQYDLKLEKLERKLFNKTINKKEFRKERNEIMNVIMDTQTLIDELIRESKQTDIEDRSLNDNSVEYATGDRLPSFIRSLLNQIEKDINKL